MLKDLKHGCMIALILYHLIADKCFDRFPKHYRETIRYVDPITRQTFNYATPIECGKNPQNIIELDPDTDDGNFMC